VPNQFAIAIVLGSRTFPELGGSFGHDTFQNSAKLVVEYFSTTRLRQAEVRILDLFDSELSVAEQDQEITRFIRRYSGANFVIIYYVGHGGFLYDRRYFLALHCTRRGKEYLTGYRIGDFATTLKSEIGSKNIILILDCCFSGEALPEFMSIDVAGVVEKNTFEALPVASTALLVAASKYDVALASDRSGRYTMFSDSFLRVLNEGIPNSSEVLTLRQIADATKSYISATYQLDGVIPEVHCPKQSNGSDIADEPLFPNAIPARVAETSLGSRPVHPERRGPINLTRLAEDMKQRIAEMKKPKRP
jgi:hypothetical protein